MPVRTAIFTVPLAVALVLKGDHLRSYSSQVEGFDVVLRIPLDGNRRSRSKKEMVAHRGEPVFKDDGGHLHKVDRKMLNRWWRSVVKLLDWAAEMAAGGRRVT